MSTNPNLASLLLDNVPWSAQMPSIWATTTLTLKRNLSRFHFPSKFNKTERQQTLDLMKEVFLKNMSAPLFFEESQLSPTDKELITEHFLLLKGFQQPPGEAGILVDQKGGLLFLLNGENHVEMCALSLSGNWDATWNLLCQIEGALSSRYDLAFSPRFGNLTSDFTQCGTALIVQAYLHLPALINLNELTKSLPGEEEEVTALGLSSSPQEMIGDMVVLRNKYTLGLTEESILQAIQTSSNRLINAEKAARTELKNKPNPQIKDLIGKAYGQLIHAYQLDIKEALSHLSLIKLGTDLGWLTGISDQKLSALFFHCRRGHLSHLYPNLTDASELEHKRAEFLHKELAGLSLGPPLQ